MTWNVRQLSQRKNFHCSLHNASLHLENKAFLKVHTSLFKLPTNLKVLRLVCKSLGKPDMCN